MAGERLLREDGWSGGQGCCRSGDEISACVSHRAWHGREFNIQGITVQSVDSNERETVMDQVLKDYPNVIVVDYTLPAAVNGQRACFYPNLGI